MAQVSALRPTADLGVATALACAANACFRTPRLAQIDPNLPVSLLRSCPSPGPTSFGFNVSEAAVRGYQDPAIS